MSPVMVGSFVSYAQNFEDVMLWRALKHVERGFYVDVGAFSPTTDSTTRAFYERGWRGVNVEPNPDLLRSFASDRPRDINLAVALGDRPGHATMHFVSNAGLSTLDPDEAQRRVDEGHTVVQRTVRIDTLASVLRDHVPAGQDVHFLKVDVEGWERNVLLGNDWTRVRPWIVIVEATRPMRPERSHQEWEQLITAAAYRFVYDDGLNRYYVANEHRELEAAFELPPNWFDGFIRASERDALERAAAAEAEARRLRESRSWRLTRPLRALAQLWRSARARVSRDTRVG